MDVTSVLTTTAKDLAGDDFCRRMAHYLGRWEPPEISPRDVLIQAVAHGLTTDENPADFAMELCTSRPLDTAETNLLALAEHTAALAEIISWILRGDSSPWERLHPVEMPNASPWTSGAFVGRNCASIRQFILAERFDAFAELSIRNSWAVLGEAAVYDLPCDVIVAVIGNHRQGRWSCPFTTGWMHPVNDELRFRKRDGTGFGGNWERVWREQSKFGLEEWLDAMTDDGVLADSLHFFTVDPPANREEIANLAAKKLERMVGEEVPDMQLSRCFDRFHPCPFRACCPNGQEPSEELGFTPRP